MKSEFIARKKDHFLLNHLNFSHCPNVDYIIDPKKPQNPTHIFTILISRSMQDVYMYNGYI